MKTRVSKISNVIFSLTFCLSLASCNKEDYYQKDYLENPFQDPTTEGTVDGGGQGGVDAGDIGDTQGGVNSGTTGGTSGSATGSTTSGTDGSVTGGTVGGTTGGVDGTTTAGSTTGSTTGGTTGGVDGTTTAGSTTGSTTGGTTTGGTTGGVDGTTTSGSTTGGAVGTPVEESFQQSASETKKLDIVWIIDDSGSMDDEQSALGTNFSAFINDFITKDVDFKMAITTTDCSSNTRCGHLVTGSDTKLTSAKAKTNETQFKADFKNLVKVGTSGSGYEMGLKASEGFMQKFATTFLRPDAYLAVVVISDEEDQSPKTVKEYTDYLKSFKSEAGLAKVYSIVDVNMTNTSTQYGVTTGFQRYADASKNTAGIVGNIRDDFYRTLEDMGGAIINLLDSFALADAAVEGSIKVWVNGVETTGFTYDSVSHSIKFNANNIPATGATIKVQYLKQ